MKLYIIGPILLLFSCIPVNKELNRASQEITLDDIEDVRKIMNLQTRAWNNGDHEGFMQAYWNSDSLRFCSRNGTQYGYNTTLEMYKKSFPNRDDMGVLLFEIDTVINRQPYLCVEGGWTIHRADTVGGRFVLLFERLNNEWKIIEDHTW